jgi:AraC-like DNA-binding protein
MRSEPTVLVRFFSLLLDDAERLGHAKGPLLRSVGVEPALLEDPDARLPLRRFIALAHEVFEPVDDTSTGVLAGSRRRVREGGLVGYTMLHSSTLGEALTRLSRYTRIISDAEEITLHVRAGSATIGLDVHPLRHAIPALFDRTAAWVVGAMREICTSGLTPLEVRFPHAAPRSLKEHRAWFRCPLTFGAPRCEIELDAAELERPVVSADSTLASYLDRLAVEALDGLGGHESVPDRVRRTVWATLADGAPNLGRTAARVGYSARTLQRRLAEAGASFEGIVDELRRELAALLLRQDRLAVYEVAFMLGYSDASQFSRAFHRWYGQTPRAYRFPGAPRRGRLRPGAIGARPPVR